MRRREFIAGLGLGFFIKNCLSSEIDFPQALPNHPLQFPRDHGAHPDFRTEWWYATGWLATGSNQPLGFQVTFFRSRLPFATGNPSAFTPRQIVFAHAALSDPSFGRLRHDQRAAREALGLAGAAENTTDAWIDDWRLKLDGDTYRAAIPAHEFALDLDLTAHAPPLLEGEGGYSRKGPRPGEASYYYSRPHLEVRGSIERGKGKEQVNGSAWLDHEWSSDYLAPEAAGWDWCGINLEDGSALMAFRIRRKGGGVYWAGGTLKTERDQTTFTPAQITFTPLRTWRSPRTSVEYPVAMRVTAGAESWDLEPLMDDQELDSRASTGAIYWEGAVRAMQGGKQAGRGYLELTGYWKPLQM
ncbi:MAG: lipocalin-like domain-containing protein [Burkholderiales bacterium]